MSQRLKVLKHWITGKKNSESLNSVLRFVFQPRSNIKARSKIISMEIEGEYFKLILKGFANPVYFPTSIGEAFVYQLVDEITDTNHWHYYMIPETRITSNDIVVDCGAAEGIFCAYAAEHCQHVYAIEPLPLFVESLTKTFSALDNVTIIPFAVSDEENIAVIEQSADGISSKVKSSSTGGIPIKISTLDKLLGDNPITYIKADLEGFDYQMILGAKDTIIKYKPKIAITTYHRKEHAQQIAEYLKSIVPEYNIRVKGIEHRYGAPVMLHAWV